MPTTTREFRAQCGDEIADAFRAFTMERECRYHAAPITRHNRDIEVAAGSTARRVARALGIGMPIIRWFTEFDYDDPRKITLSGVAFPYYGAIYLNRGLSVRDVPYVTAHETAHLGGYDSEQAADRFAAQFVVDHGGTTPAASVGGDVVWRGAGVGWREVVVR